MAEAFEEHPIFSRSYAVYTPSILEFFETIRSWIELQITGAYIYGTSRVGKTRAVKFWIGQLLCDAYDNRIAVFTWIHQRTQHPSQLAALRVLSNALKLKFSSGRSSIDMEWRIANFMAARAIQAGKRHVVLLVDEAQDLHEHEYAALCNIQNLLDDVGVQFTLIGVGTHDQSYKHEVFALGKSFHYAARFAKDSARFHGVRSHAELALILDQYDTHSEWPLGSGISFTCHFFPQGYARGLRLSEYAATLWDMYIFFAPTRLREELEVPMEYVARAVDNLLKSNQETDGRPRLALTQDELRSAIVKTRYAGAMRSINNLIA
jgi:hypothetical protein